jgi:hydroxyacyl-ACP dehydratase HTD2-like protein with hotdog domain
MIQPERERYPEIATLREALGAQAVPIRYEIDEGSIKYFADSIMDPDLRYRPEKTANGEPLRAPLTFFGSAVGLRDVAAGDSKTMSALELPLPDGWAQLATGDEFEFHQPVVAGMALVCRERFLDVYEKHGRSGRLVFYTIEKVFTTTGGEPVVRRVLHCVAREPVPPAQAPRPAAYKPDLAPQGSELPSLVVGPVTVRYLAMFATATAEYVDIHYDADHARSLGLPGPIIQGLYKTALIARMLKDWTGDEALVRSLSVQHRGMDLAGSVLTVCGTAGSLTGDGTNRHRVCQVRVQNQHGVATTYGTALVAQSPGLTCAALGHLPTEGIKEYRQR